MATSMPAMTVATPHGNRAGGVEDRYRSLFLVGRGGMGTVEVALERGTGGFERVVALKRLIPERASDPHRKEMFLREAQLAALLEHPNVVHAFAFGELYGELFLAMEYVEGQSLSRVLSLTSQGRLDPAMVAFVLAEVCDGLHAAHELCDLGGNPLHVVHRDVSPHNVMVAYDGHVKLLDFGVAKFETGGNETRTGEVKGKMAYMSPQQALSEKLDRRSDLYSVGAVLYECLTGERMWGHGTDLEVMRRLALEEPPALRDVPPALAALHARLVARDPDKRPATAEEVARELRAYAETSPTANRAGVAAMMDSAFAVQAREAREQLNDALAQEAPARADVLRRTIDPDSTFDGPTLLEPLIVNAESRRSIPPVPVAPTQARTWRRPVGIVIAALAVAGIVAVAAARTARETPVVDRAVTSPQAATTAATATPTAPPIPPETHSIAAGTGSENATAAASSTTAPTVLLQPTTPKPTTAVLRGPARPPKPPAGPRPPDVDPTPF